MLTAGSLRATKMWSAFRVEMLPCCEEIFQEEFIMAHDLQANIMPK
jgi:hypothetical protein